MAGVESATAPPQVPPPMAAPTSALRVAHFVVTLSLVGFFGFAWLSSAANAALFAVEWGYGEGSIEAAATKEFALAASALLGLFLHALVLLILGMCWRKARQDGGAGGTATQPGHVHQDDLIPGAVVVAVGVLFMTVALGALISWTNGARGERADHLLLETALLLSSLIFCFVTSPLLIIGLFVSTRAERRETTG